MKNDEIHFKYSPKIRGIGICEYCGKAVTLYYPSMYCIADIEYLCLPCIASGAAASKFDGEFIQAAEVDKVSNPERHQELFERTPGFISWQREYWLACYDDFCAYLGNVGTAELETKGIADYEARDE